jgi:phosphonate transport system substrate-binding protein
VVSTADGNGLSRRGFLKGAGAVVLAGAGGMALAACGGGSDKKPAGAATGGTGTTVPSMLRFGVGPLLATPTDTKAAYAPFFAWLAGQLGTKHELTAVDSWGGISVALGSNQLDLAWMGPFGYVLANERSGAQAVATAKYDDKPIYHAIVVSRPSLVVNSWPEDGKGRSISFAEVSSTSGWLVPTYWFKQRNIDPKTYFKYSEGAAHPANELAVATGQVDFATDYDRNRTAMIENGQLKATDTKVVWTSDPLPNDAIGLRKGIDAGLGKHIQDLLVGLTAADAKPILPNHYTGFIAADNGSYKSIRDAALSLDALKG